MAEKRPQTDLSKEIDRSARTISVGALKKRGLQKVKVLRPSDIEAMILKAVDHAIARESRSIAEAEREKYVESSKAELKKLMQQWTESTKRQQELELSRDGLQKRVQELHRTVDLQKDEIGRLEETAKGKQPGSQQEALEQAGKEKLELQGQLKVLNTALDQVTEANRKMKDELEDARRSGGGGGGQIESLLVAMFQQMQESRQQSSGVAEIGEHIGKMADKLSEAIGSKLSAGGGPGISKATTAEFKEVMLDKLFKDDGSKDLESNIGSIGAKEKKAGGVEGALKKLRSLQKGGKDE